MLNNSERFADLVSCAEELKGEWSNHDEKFYSLRSGFSETLLAHLKDHDFILSLSAYQIIEFLSWCSSYRPCEPHAILTSFSRMNERIGHERATK